MLVPYDLYDPLALFLGQGCATWQAQTFLEEIFGYTAPSNPAFREEGL